MHSLIHSFTIVFIDSFFNSFIHFVYTQKNFLNHLLFFYLARISWRWVNNSFFVHLFIKNFFDSFISFIHLLVIQGLFYFFMSVFISPFMNSFIQQIYTVNNFCIHGFSPSLRVNSFDKKMNQSFNE